MTRNLDDKLTREFKTNLQRLLQSRGTEINPKKLSLMAGLGETAVRDLLQNRAHSPKLETVHKLAAALDIGVYDLIPSLIGTSYSEIESLRAENQALREALDSTYTTMEDSLKTARERTKNLKRN